MNTRRFLGISTLAAIALAFTPAPPPPRAKRGISDEGIDLLVENIAANTGTPSDVVRRAVADLRAAQPGLDNRALQQFMEDLLGRRCARPLPPPPKPVLFTIPSDGLADHARLHRQIERNTFGVATVEIVTPREDHRAAHNAKLARRAERARKRDEGIARAKERQLYGEWGEQGPPVCPGCHAVAEPCAPGCIDQASEEEREEERRRDAEDREWNGLDDNDEGDLP